jgi:hypothetical protein
MGLRRIAMSLRHFFCNLDLKKHIAWIVQAITMNELQNDIRFSISHYVTKVEKKKWNRKSCIK